jgi:23S rRNA pseudouridine1911/1915/1917 synthase
MVYILTDRHEDLVTRRVELLVPLAKLPERLDIYISSQVAEVSRSRSRNLIKEGMVFVDGNVGKPSQSVKPGQTIHVDILSYPTMNILPENIPIDIHYEDEHLIIVNKPAGMVIHPAKGNVSGTLVNALLGHYSDQEHPLATTDDPDRPGIVHRLDKNTSGLLVVCKKQPALSMIAEYFRNRTIEREYSAIVWWKFPVKSGTIDEPIGRDIRDRKKYAVNQSGKSAVTHWKLIENFDFMSHVSVRLETGRTHQIRVHLESKGHPVFGDQEYGGRNRQISKLGSAQRKAVGEYLQVASRQMLHARVLGFIHPITKDELHFEIEPPEDYMTLLNMLRE